MAHHGSYERHDGFDDLLRWNAVWRACPLFCGIADNSADGGGAWVGAVYTPADALTSGQKELVALSDGLIDELFAANEYVIGIPIHNFSLPSTLKL